MSTFNNIKKVTELIAQAQAEARKFVDVIQKEVKDSEIGPKITDIFNKLTADIAKHTNDPIAKKRLDFMIKHEGLICTRDLQLNRRPPIQYKKVYIVDWNSHDGHEILPSADWGCDTPEEAIDKAIKEEEELSREFKK